jgi:hypothetical protein
MPEFEAMADRRNGSSNGRGGAAAAVPPHEAPLPFFPAQSLQERRAANQRAALISAANATSCLPPNGYMDAPQPLE